MKKLLTLVMACAMMLCLTLPASAAYSITDIADVSFDGAQVTVSDSAQNLTAATAASLISGANASDLTVVYLHDLTPTNGATSAILSFTINGNDANDKWHVFHGTGSSWEVVASGTGKTGSVTLTKFSPYAIVRQTVSNSSKAPSSTAGGTTPAKTSPQTGNDMTVVFFGLAVMVVAGAVAYKARKEEL